MRRQFAPTLVPGRCACFCRRWQTAWTSSTCAPSLSRHQQQCSLALMNARTRCQSGPQLWVPSYGCPPMHIGAISASRLCRRSVVMSRPWVRVAVQLGAVTRLSERWVRAIEELAQEAFKPTLENTRLQVAWVGLRDAGHRSAGAGAGQPGEQRRRCGGCGRQRRGRRRVRAPCLLPNRQQICTPTKPSSKQ